MPTFIAAKSLSLRKRCLHADHDHVVTPPFAPHPPQLLRTVEHRQPDTLIARVRPGKRVGVRLTPSGPVVAWLPSRTEFGSPQTLAVTQVLPGRR